MKVKRKIIKGRIKKLLFRGTAVVCAASLLAISPVADRVVKADREISSETEVKFDADMKKQALEIAAIVKKKIDLPKGKSDFSFNNVGDSGKKWSFTWNAKDGSWSVYVQCDSKGRIYQMSFNEEKGEGELPKFKYIGKNLEDKMFKSLEKLVPQTKGNLKIEDCRYDSYDGNVVFNLYRTYDGVPVRDNSITVVMDCSTGKMLEMYGDWNYDVKFPSKTGIISKKEAKETGKNALNMELQYILKRERVNSGKESGLYGSSYSIKGILCYKGDKDYLSIDAVTGKVYDTRSRGNDHPSNDYDDAFNSAADKEEAAGESGLTQEEIEEIEKLDGVISAKEAADKVMGKPGLYRPAGMAYSDGRLYREKEGTSDIFYWDLRFKFKNQEDYSYAYAVVNAKTGEIISYRIYTGGKKPAGSLKSESALKETVVSFMKDNYPEYYAKTKCSDTGEAAYWHENGSKGVMGYSYVFTRIENGVPCPENNIVIRISADKGEIYGINRSWDYVTGFEGKSGIISSNEAEDNYFGAREFALEYEINTDADGKNEARLVYTTEKIYPKLIKASNGKRMYSWGEIYKESNKDGYKYSDISKSRYKESIEFLAELNIGFEADKFMPDKAITRGEFLELVEKSSLYQIRLNDFEENPDKEITRMEITRLTLNSLGYEKILKNGDIFNLSYQDKKDIKQADKGYAAMAGVYGFFWNGKKHLGGKFEGNKKLTRGEAASLIAALYRI